MKANERLVLELIRAVEERDEERMWDFYDPAVEFVWPPSLPGYGGTYRGAEVARMDEAWTAAWDPVQPSEETRRTDPRVVASNDIEVVVHYHQRGIDRSGRRCDSEVLGLYRVERGRITRLQMFYFDPEHVRDFLTAAVGRATAPTVPKDMRGHAPPSS